MRIEPSIYTPEVRKDMEGKDLVSNPQGRFPECFPYYGILYVGALINRIGKNEIEQTKEPGARLGARLALVGPARQLSSRCF